MARILVVTNGSRVLQSSIAALRLAGHRVTPREFITPHDLRHTAPDLVIVAPGAGDTVRSLVRDLRADAPLRRVPVIVAGAADASHVLEPSAPPVSDTMVLPAPLDPMGVFDAAHLFVPSVAVA